MRALLRSRPLLPIDRRLLVPSLWNGRGRPNGSWVSARSIDILLDQIRFEVCRISLLTTPAIAICSFPCV